MRLLRTVTLLVAAILVTKLAVTEGGVAFSVAQLLTELSSAEAERRTAYEVIIGFCLPALGLAIATGILIYRQAKRLPSRTLTIAVASVSLLLYGLHLAFAYLIRAANPVLREYIDGFVWLSGIGLGVAAALVIVEFALGSDAGSDSSKSHVVKSRMPS